MAGFSTGRRVSGEAVADAIVAARGRRDAALVQAVSEMAAIRRLTAPVTGATGPVPDVDILSVLAVVGVPDAERDGLVERLREAGASASGSGEGGTE
jgi:hypothetical protein